MLELVTATRFDRRMSNGKTKPALMSCERTNGTDVEAVVKFSGGCERGVAGLVIEAVVAMLAADLALPVPEPLLVQMQPQLVDLIPDIEVQALARRSSVVAFGSCLLPPSFSVWIHSRTIPHQLQQQALEIFAFDALLMNADRRPLNPNCQSNGSTFAIFDHELCFVAPLFRPMPWEPGALEYLRATGAGHLFQASLHGTSLNLDRFAGAVEAVTPARLEEYVAALPQEWNSANEAAVAATQHVAAMRANIEPAISEVIRVLS
jgi:hypothetical protein